MAVKEPPAWLWEVLKSTPVKSLFFVEQITPRLQKWESENGELIMVDTDVRRVLNMTTDKR